MTSRETRKPSFASASRHIDVVRGDGGWEVRCDRAGRTADVYRTEADAHEAAKAVLRKSGGTLAVHGSDGRLRESMTLGRDAMAKIAAVEGIHLSRDMRRTLDELDRTGASSAERRRAVALQFGKKG